MISSEQLFYFQAHVRAMDADREHWAQNAELSEQNEKIWAATSRRLNAEYAERQRTLCLEERHALALAFLRRAPLTRVATTRAEVVQAVGRGLLQLEVSGESEYAREWSRHAVQRAEERAGDTVVSMLMDKRAVFDDGITYPDIGIIATKLADLDGVPGWYDYLSLPHVMTAEQIFFRLTNFKRPEPPH